MEVLMLLLIGLGILVGAGFCLIVMVCFPPLMGLAVSIVGFNAGLGWLSVPLGIGWLCIFYAILDQK